ncbi:MAG: pseudaminic acid synthase [Gammaproteobacteria bacterium]
MNQRSIRIAGRLIGADAPPFVIAEVSANHNGDLDRALAIMTAARDAGADAIKLQTYTADSITIDHDGPEFTISGGLWDGYTLYQLYQEAHTPPDWHPALFEHGRKLGIPVFSTPFDESAVDFLEELGAPAYKIASFEAIDLPLIRKAASTGKPLIISTGMANEIEIGAAVDAARGAGCDELVLLHCVSSYPAPADEYNLRTVADLARRFDVVAGLSDHTLGIAVAVSAVALGAAVIEKHFTMRRSDGGPDSSFSLEPDELAALCSQCRIAHAALGQPTYDRVGSEQGNAIFRRSLYVVADIAAGEPFTTTNVRSIRPGHGVAPDRMRDLLGRTAPHALKRGTPVTPDLLGD